MKNKITVIAHRSGPMTYPEQTMAAATEAVWLGADLIEMDVRFTKEGGMIVSHDANLKRVFGKDYNVSDISATFFYNLHRSGKDAAFRGHIFDDYLKDRAFPLLVHVKEGGEEHLKKIKAKVDRYANQPRIVYGVESKEDIKTIKALSPDTEVLAFIPKEEMLDEFLATDAEYIRLWEGWMTKERIEKIHSAGKKVWIMTGECDGRPVGVCDGEKLDAILAEDIDGILINDIRKVIKK